MAKGIFFIYESVVVNEIFVAGIIRRVDIDNVDFPGVRIVQDR